MAGAGCASRPAIEQSALGSPIRTSPRGIDRGSGRHPSFRRHLEPLAVNDTRYSNNRQSVDTIPNGDAETGAASGKSRKSKLREQIETVDCNCGIVRDGRGGRCGLGAEGADRDSCVDGLPPGQGAVRRYLRPTHDNPVECEEPDCQETVQACTDCAVSQSLVGAFVKYTRRAGRVSRRSTTCSPIRLFERHPGRQLAGFGRARIDVKASVRVNRPAVWKIANGLVNRLCERRSSPWAFCPGVPPSDPGLRARAPTPCRHLSL